MLQVPERTSIFNGYAEDAKLTNLESLPWFQIVLYQNHFFPPHHPQPKKKEAHLCEYPTGSSLTDNMLFTEQVRGVQNVMWIWLLVTKILTTI